MKVVIWPTVWYCVIQGSNPQRLMKANLYVTYYLSPSVQVEET